MSFKPRSKTTFGIPPPKHSSEVHLDTKSFIRQAPTSLRDKPCKTAQQRLWMDITDLDTSNIEKTDEGYDSNMWKNFKFVRSKASAGSLVRVGSNSFSKAKKVALPRTVKPTIDNDTHVRGMIADVYPLRLPQPSTIGRNTYDKFLGEAKLKEGKKERINRQLERTQKVQNKMLEIRSECRAPPINLEGEIIPPKDFRKYPLRPMGDDDSWFESKPLTYVAQTSRPYTGTPGSRYGSPWKQGLRGRGRRPEERWEDRL